MEESISMTNINIEPLVSGDKIALIAPAGKIDKSDYQLAIKHLESWNLKIVIGKNIEKTNSVFAGTDKERANDLQRALNDESIKAIICARGGYGTIRTLEYIDWSNFKKQPKIICGFSDITVLHSVLSNMNIKSLHCIMPINFPKATPEAIDSFKHCLFNGDNQYTIHNEKLNKKGKAKGQLVGGNVSILLALKGTEIEFDYTNKILFIEDVAETNYHLDRMMQNFKRTIFNKISGLIVGQFSEMKDGTTSFGKTAYEIISDACENFNFPIAFNFPAGHIPDNRSLWMNFMTELHVTDNDVNIKQTND